MAAFDRRIAEQVEIDAKYAVYLSRQEADVESYRRDEGLVLPDDIDYAAFPGFPTKSATSCNASAAHHRPCRPDRWHDAGSIDVAVSRICGEAGRKPIRGAA